MSAGPREAGPPDGAPEPADGGDGEQDEAAVARMEGEGPVAVAAEVAPAADPANEALRSELEETRDRMLRIAADYENFRKRAQREQSERARFASESLLRDLLPVADNLMRAAAMARGNDAADPAAAMASLLEGVELILRQFRSVFSRFGVSEIPASGEAFDPNLHEAVGTVETTEIPEDTVADEVQKGYRLHDRVLRPAVVRVARAPVQAEPADTPPAE